VSTLMLALHLMTVCILSTDRQATQLGACARHSQGPVQGVAARRAPATTPKKPTTMAATAARDRRCVSTG